MCCASFLKELPSCTEPQCRTYDYLEAVGFTRNNTRLVGVLLLMCAVRIAFIEDNINLTSNFHLIFWSGGGAHMGLSRHRLRRCMFLSHILPPSVSVEYYSGEDECLPSWQPVPVGVC